jgi:hypothetical protein
MSDTKDPFNQIMLLHGYRLAQLHIEQLRGLECSTGVI